MLDPRAEIYAEFEKRHTPAPGRTLIVGSNLYDTGKEDRRKRYNFVVGVDAQDGPGVDVVADLEGKIPPSLACFNHIECTSVLEHSKRPWLLASNLERMLPSQGTIFLAVPFVWRVHNYPADYWRFTRDGVLQLFPNIRWHELTYAHYKIDAKGKVPKLTANNHPYLGRCEVLGFGERA